MRSIKKRLAGVAVTGALAVAGVAGFMAPASASTASAHMSMVRINTAVLPNVNIKGSPGTWSPTSLSVTPKPFTTCTAAKEVWTITNTTAASKVLSYKPAGGTKMLLGTLPAHAKAGICSQGPAGAKSTFYIKGSTSHLILTLK